MRVVALIRYTYALVFSFVSATAIVNKCAKNLAVILRAIIWLFRVVHLQIKVFNSMTVWPNELVWNGGSTLQV